MIVTWLPRDCHVIVDDFNTLERFSIARVGFESKFCPTLLKLLRMISVHTCGYGVDENTISMYHLLQNGPLLSTTCKKGKSEMYSC